MKCHIWPNRILFLDDLHDKNLNYCVTNNSSAESEFNRFSVVSAEDRFSSFQTSEEKSELSECSGRCFVWEENKKDEALRLTFLKLCFFNFFSQALTLLAAHLSFFVVLWLNLCHVIFCCLPRCDCTFPFSQCFHFICTIMSTYIKLCTGYTWIFSHFPMMQVHTYVLQESWADPKFCPCHTYAKKRNKSVQTPMMKMSFWHGETTPPPKKYT